MAWQSSGPMGAGNGGNGGSGGDGSQTNQPQGIEYTLQGVMRFLQTEWHRHERDRNAWEIERQEMKARIASLEGSSRRADAQQASLKKYVRMLENVVAQERKKAKTASSAGKKEEDVYEVPEKPKSRRMPKEVPHNSFLAIDENEPNMDDLSSPDKSNLLGYLSQCSGEFTYLMVAPSNPPPPAHSIPDSLGYEEEARQAAMQSQHAMEEMYIPGAIQKSQHERPRAMLSGSPPPPAPTIPSTMDMPLRELEAQDASMTHAVDSNETPQTMEGQWSSSFQGEQPEEEPIIEISHTYDANGRPVENTEGASFGRTTEAEGWDFSVSEQYPETESKPALSRPDNDVFPVAQDTPVSPNRLGSYRRKGSMSRRRSVDKELSTTQNQQKTDGHFKVRYGLRGHLDVVRSIIFTGGGSPGEPEICTAGDDGIVRRWVIPSRVELQGNLHNNSADLDVQSYFTHRGHSGSVMCLAAYSPSLNFANAGRTQGDGWVFSGGQDATVRVWERGRIDPKAVLDGHTDAVWTICVLPTTCGAIFGASDGYGPPDRLLLASGSADGSVKVWSVTAPPVMNSPQAGSGRRGGRVRGNSMSSGSGLPTSPQPSVASNSPFHYTLIHTITRNNSGASPTCITPLSTSGENFVVAYSDAAVLVYDTRTGEEMASMASLETYRKDVPSGVNAVVATSSGLDGSLTFDSGRSLSEDDATVHGATGSSSGIEGIIISGHEDRYIRFYDANSGQCTYNMLAHPAAISSLSMSPDCQELVSAGHDASLRFWSLEKRSCTQEITSHRLMRGEGVCAVVWSQDGRFVVSGGGDGVVKVFAR